MVTVHHIYLIALQGTTVSRYISKQKQNGWHWLLLDCALGPLSETLFHATHKESVTRAVSQRIHLQDIQSFRARLDTRTCRQELRTGSSLHRRIFQNDFYRVRGCQRGWRWNNQQGHVNQTCVVGSRQSKRAGPRWLQGLIERAYSYLWKEIFLLILVS
jgi:hypothetical protein